MTGLQATELLRPITRPWSLALGIAAVANVIDQRNAVRLLECAQQIGDPESQLLAIAGLVAALPAQLQPRVCAEAASLAGHSSPLAKCLAMSIANRCEDQPQPWPPEARAAVKDQLTSWVWDDMDECHRRFGEIIRVLHPADQAEFARVAFRAGMSRGYRYKEIYHAWKMVGAIVDFSPIDLLPALTELLESAPDGREMGHALITVRYAVLGELGGLEVLLPTLKTQDAWVLGAALRVMPKSLREVWEPHWRASLQDRLQDMDNWGDIRRYPDCFINAERSEFVRRSWQSARTVRDSYQVILLARSALPFVSEGQRARLADHIAAMCRAELPRGWTDNVISIAEYISAEWVGRLADSLPYGDAGMLLLAPRFSMERRQKVLREVLDNDHIPIDTRDALNKCLQRLAGTEQLSLADQIIERITGRSAQWAHTRSSSLIWAELIEAFGPTLIAIRGEAARQEMERIVPDIQTPTDRALAFSVLAVGAPEGHSVRLARLAVLAFDDEQPHRLDELDKLGPLLLNDAISEPPPGRMAAEQFEVRLQRLQSRFLEAKQRYEQDEVRQLVAERRFRVLESQWRELVRSGHFSAIEIGARELAGWGASERGNVQALWLAGLEQAAQTPRPNLLRYLKVTFPLLQSMLTQNQLDVAMASVTEVLSWPWP